MKDGFVIYKSFYKPISRLSDRQLGRLFRAIFLYQLGEVVTVEEDIEMAFEFFKNQFEIDESKYRGIVERNRSNGRKGGAPQGNGNAKKEEQPKQPSGPQNNPNNPVGPKQPKTTHKEKDKEKEKDYYNPILSDESIPPSGEISGNGEGNEAAILPEEKKKSSAKKEKTAFRPPSLQEVTDYCKEKGYSVNPWKFVNYYASNGWMVGRNHMKDWRAAVRSWESKEHDYGGKDSENKTCRGAGGGVRQEDSLAQKDYSGSF